MKRKTGRGGSLGLVRAVAACWLGLGMFAGCASSDPSQAGSRPAGGDIASISQALSACNTTCTATASCSTACFHDAAAVPVQLTCGQWGVCATACNNSAICDGKCGTIPCDGTSGADTKDCGACTTSGTTSGTGAGGSSGNPPPGGCATCGRLSIHPNNPHYFRDESGNPVLLAAAKTVTPAMRASLSQDYDYPGEVSAIQGKVNYTRVWNVAASALQCAIWPWMPSVPTCSPNPVSYDLSTFNTTYFSRLTHALTLLGNADIAGEVMLFDGGNRLRKAATWERGPWAQKLLELGIDRGFPYFHQYREPLYNLQKAWADKLVDETISYNVIYEIENESEASPTATFKDNKPWFSYWANYLKQYAQGRHQRSILVAHNQGLATSPSPGFDPYPEAFADSAVNIVNIEFDDAGDLNGLVRYLQQQWSKNKVMNVDEFGNDQGLTYDQLRTMAWSIVAAGGHFHIEDAPGAAQPLRISGNVLGFLNQSNWNFIGSYPIPSGTTGPTCTAPQSTSTSPADYICYYPPGTPTPTFFDVGEEGTYAVKWWDPTWDSASGGSGFAVDGGQRQTSGGRLQIPSVPAAHDWVLFLRQTAKAPPRNSQFVSQTVPATMTTGGQYAVSLTFKNTGTVDWTPITGTNAYRLGSQNQQDNLTWGLGRVVLPNAVPAGQSVTLTFNVTAPTTPGTYNFQWRMLQEGITWFGAFSNNVPVVVSGPPQPRDVQWVSQSVPTSMTPGGQYGASITLKNVGTLDWSPVGPMCNAYRLASDNPLSNSNWGFSRVEFPAAVPSGQTVTLNFTVTAPSTAGTYNFQWHMVQECVTWFGQPSPNVPVSVAPVPKGDVLFLMGATGANMTPGDSAAMNHLIALGYTVTPFYACSATAANAAGKALVIIGGSTPVGTCGDAVGSAFQSVGVPTIVSKAAMLPKMLMTSAGNNSGWGSVTNQSQVTIVDPASPLAAGLTGTVTVETAAMPWFAWGHANANATVGASVVGSGAWHTLFGYPKNVLMPGGFAPACRVGAWWGDNGPASFNANGWKLFDAAVSWATTPACR